MRGGDKVVVLTRATASGICLLLDGEELSLPFSEFPWFREATISQLSNMERATSDHLYWPELDVDLSVDSIRRPDAYPLKSHVAR